MLDKILIKRLYKEDMNMSEIARKFNVSPQRIQQIVKNYTSFTNHNFSYVNYPNLRLFNGCRECGGRVEIIHYKNHNPNNNNEKNLVPLCKKCHFIKHKWRLPLEEKSVRVTYLQNKFKKKLKRLSKNGN